MLATLDDPSCCLHGLLRLLQLLGLALAVQPVGDLLFGRLARTLAIAVRIGRDLADRRAVLVLVFTSLLDHLLDAS